MREDNMEYNSKVRISTVTNPTTYFMMFYFDIQINLRKSHFF